MQSEAEWIVELFEGDIRESDPRNLRTFQLGTDRACRTKPRQIARESIGDIHHRGCQALLRQPLAQCQARFWIKGFFCERVLLARHTFASLQNAQTQFCFSQPPTDIDDVAGISSSPQ